MIFATSRRLPTWSAPLVLAALAAAAIWSHGAGFPSGNNLYHLPLVLDYAGSAEGPHDAFHRSLEAFVSLFWSGVALVATEANVRPLFLSLLLGATVATVLAAYATARAAGAAALPAAAALGLLSFVFVVRGVFEFGGGELLSPSLTHSQVATALCLAAAALAVRGRWLAAAVLCGIAADVNLFLGFWTMMAITVARLIGDRDRDGRIDWWGVSRMALACLLATLPALYWALGTLNPDTPPIPYRAFLADYHPFHFFAHHEAWLLVAHVGLLAITAIALRRQAAASRLRRLGDLLLAAAVTLSIGAASGYVTDQPLVLNLHPLRFAAVAYWLAAVGAIALWSRSVAAKGSRPDWTGVAVLGFLMPSPALTAVAIALSLDLRRLATWQRVAVVVAVFAALMVASSSQGRFDFPLWLRIGAVPATAIVAACCGLMLRGAGLRSWRETVAASALLALVIGSRTFEQPLAAVACALLSLGLVWRLQQPVADRGHLALAAAAAVALLSGVLLEPATATRVGLLVVLLIASTLVGFVAAARDRRAGDASMGLAAVTLAAFGLAATPQRGFDFPVWDKDEAWFEAQAWARTNTPPGTVFYAPDRFGFAALSRRPVWWDHNQGAAVMWDPGYFNEWATRRELALRATDTAALATLVREQQIRYLVRECGEFEDAAARQFAIRYRNDFYCIAEPVPTVESSDLARATQAVSPR